MIDWPTVRAQLKALLEIASDARWSLRRIARVLELQALGADAAKAIGDPCQRCGTVLQPHDRHGPVCRVCGKT